jgi:hypothetical protein
MEIIFNNGEHGVETEIERMWIEREFKPEIKLRVGKMHSPLGFWNYNYHHGVLVQDTVTRPFFLEFEEGHEGIFPTHLIGLMANGMMRKANYALSYSVGVGNGPTINTSHVEFELDGANNIVFVDGVPQIEHGAELEVNNYDLNKNKLVVGRLAYTNLVKRFQIGAFAMRNDIVEGSDDAAPTSGLLQGSTLFDQTVAGADFRYSGEKMYLMSELFYLRTVDKIVNANLAPVHGAHNSYAFYIQLGLRFWDKFTPVYRFEGSNLHSDDSYYIARNIVQETHHVIGFRYELDDNNALRFEVNQAQKTHHESETTAALQWFFLLF